MKSSNSIKQAKTPVLPSQVEHFGSVVFVRSPTDMTLTTYLTLASNSAEVFEECYHILS